MLFLLFCLSAMRYLCSNRLKMLQNTPKSYQSRSQNPYFPLKYLIFSFSQTFYKYKWFLLIMQQKFRFFEGIVIEYIISKKTRFCCIYNKTCYGPIAKMLFLNMLYNHGKLCASIIKCTMLYHFTPIGSTIVCLAHEHTTKALSCINKSGECTLK